MRTEAPRVPMVRDDQLTPEHLRAVGAYAESGKPLLNIHRAMLNKPAAREAFAAPSMYLLSSECSLTARQRELLILRTGYLCRSGYEFAQHTRISLAGLLSAEEVARVKRGPASDWENREAVLIEAADEIVKHHHVSDRTWLELTASYSILQAMDVVYCVTQYVQISTILNVFGVQLDDDLKLDPDLDWRESSADT